MFGGRVWLRSGAIGGVDNIISSLNSLLGFWRDTMHLLEIMARYVFL
jgi:hypothetical protein